MSSHHKLPNYLRRHRKRAGLSHKDVAFLLGLRDASHISRYENFNRHPCLLKALALSAIFQIHAHELFSGEYLKVEKIVFNRAKRLAQKLPGDSRDNATQRKLAFLRTIGVTVPNAK